VYSISKLIVIVCPISATESHSKGIVVDTSTVVSQTKTCCKKKKKKKSRALLNAYGTTFDTGRM